MECLQQAGNFLLGYRNENEKPEERWKIKMVQLERNCEFKDTLLIFKLDSSNADRNSEKN